MPELSVQLHDVVKYHGEAIGVDHLSLEIRQGEFFSILGPSGSGKTTTLRLIAGLDQPDQGAIVIQGQVMGSRPPNLRPVNMVFQHYALFPHLSVFHNVAFGLKMKGRPGAEIKRNVGDILDLVRLNGKQDRFPSQLSGGEQQRVALARALVNHPAVLLLDEPLGALDQQLRQDMRVELKQIQEQVRSTFICVTHHQEEALMLSDRVAVMNHGSVLQVGTPQEIYESPVSTFIARFIGLSNSFTGRITNFNGEVCTVSNKDFPQIHARCPVDGNSNSEVTVIIRPERLRLSSHPDRNKYENSVSGTIQKATFNGNEMVYQLDLPGGVVWMARRALSGSQSSHFQKGQSVYVQWQAQEGLVLTE